MVFFLTLLHAIVQMPKDMLKDGITHCFGGRKVYQSSADGSSKIMVPYEKIDKIQNSVENKIKSVYSSITPEELKMVRDSFASVYSKSFWASGEKNIHVILNGYNAKDQISFMYAFTFSNEDGLAAKNRLYFQVPSAKTIIPASIPNYLAVTSYQVIDGKIANKALASSQKFMAYPAELMEVLAEPVATLVNGFGITIDTSFLKVAAQHILENSERYAELLPYITSSQKEIDAQLGDYIKFGIVDLAPINKEILRICSITPTPSPAPSAAPAAEDNFYRPHHERNFRVHHALPIRKLQKEQFN